MNKDMENFGFPGATRPQIDPESPVYPSLMSMMMVDLVLSPESDVWLIYERPLPEALKWIEYDLDLESLILVSLSGKVQDFGMKVPPAMKKYLRRAKQIYAILFSDEKINDMCFVPLVVREPLSEN